MGTPLLAIERIRALEREWIARSGPGVLMRRAAAAVAATAEQRLRTMPAATPVLVLAGPGNNGGDALLAAQRLRARGYAVSAYSSRSTPPGDGDAAGAWRSWLAEGPMPAPLAAALDALHRSGATAPLVIDGLFGIGLARPLDGDARAIASVLAPGRVRSVDARGAHLPTVVAIDVPSGIDADRGCVVGGAGARAIAATTTVTMLADKPGLHTGTALDHVGEVVVATLGIEASDAAPADEAVLFTDVDAARLWLQRRRDTHKGSFGDLLIAGGGCGMTGAALLAARGAQACGAGKIHLASPAGPLFDPGQPQWMSRAWDAPLDGIDAAVVGCGMGTDDLAHDGLERLLASDLALVLDADALTLIAGDPALSRLTAQRSAATVCTPHPLEAARLLRIATADVQSDRFVAARALASRTRATVLLKGAGTLIDDGHVTHVLDAGSPALATAGTGDVLAGMIGALLAQRREPLDSALAAAWAHGRGAMRWQHDHRLGIGLSAAELPALARIELNQLESRR